MVRNATWGGAYMWRCIGDGGDQNPGAIVFAQRDGCPKQVGSHQEVDRKPTFSVVLASEARNRSVSGRRVELLQEYIGYIQRVAFG